MGPATVPGFKTGSNQIQTDSNRFQNLLNFDRSKKNLPELQKFEIKYGFKDLEKTNNFLHRNFFRFGRYFE
jgi:hypothetical protein